MAKTFNLGIKIDLLNKVTAPLKKVIAAFSKLKRKLGEVASKFDKVRQAAAAAGKKMIAAGKNLTRKVTLPILALGGAAIKMSMDFNKGMANVASLLDGNKSAVAKRVNSLGNSVQNLAIKFGTSTTDLTSSLYRVVSALGDTKDSMSILGIATKASKAGVSSSAEAFQLLSAVTKAYGDTSKGAFKKVADLAFQTVKLGDTTFPELAQAIGMVTPFTETLGLSQKELFGVFATGTGVTGNASRVATQYTSILSALLKPSEAMAKVAKDNEFATSAQMLKTLGLVKTLKLLKKVTGENKQKAMALFGRKEAGALFFSLTGKQAKTLDIKMQKLGKSFGALDKAYDAQTKGVNKVGFSWKRFLAVLQVFGQKIGSLLLPILQTLIDIITPIISFFQNLPKPIQKIIVAIALFAAAIGPLLVAFGALMKVMVVFKILMTFLAANPIVIIIAAIIVAVILLIKYWKQIKAFFVKVWKFIIKIFQHAWKIIKLLPFMWLPLLLIKQWGKIGGFFKNLWGSISELATDAWNTILEVINTVIGAVKAAIGFTLKLLRLGRSDVDTKQTEKAQQKGVLNLIGPGIMGLGNNSSKADIVIRVKADKGSSTQIDSVKKSGNANVNVKNQSTIGRTR